MNQSESIKELATALVKAQASMGGAVKSTDNDYFSSTYADLTSIIKVIKKPFEENGLSYTQFPVTSSGGKGIGVVTMLMHTSGEWLQSEYFLPMKLTQKNPNGDPQTAGSAITYARRYALQAMAGIPAVDDDAEAAMLRNEEPLLPDGVPNEKPAKRVNKKLVQDIVRIVCEAESTGETSAMTEALAELEEHEKGVVWKQLTGAQQELIRELKIKGI